jgi:hypothetical protein
VTHACWSSLVQDRVFIGFPNYDFGELEDCTSLVIRLSYVHELHYYAH